MNSPFANLFLSLQQQIKDTISTIKYVDQDLGQLDRLNNGVGKVRPSVEFPCVLIDFSDFHFSNLAENVQTTNGIIVLKLGFAPKSRSAQDTPTTYLQQAIEYYDIEWSIHKELQGWTPGDAYGYLNRIEVSTLKRNDGYRVREMKYSINFDDYSTKNLVELVTAAPIIVEEVVL